MEPRPPTLGQQMRAERDRRGLSVREVAIALDVEVTDVARLERDLELLTPELLARIRRWFDDGSTGVASRLR